MTTVHPGFIKTPLVRNSTVAQGLDQSAAVRVFEQKLARTSPERAAQIILDGVSRGKAKVLVGTDARILDVVIRLTGSGYQRVNAELARRFLPPSR